MSSTSDTQHVASPCTSVCTIDPVNGLCAGCYRTLDEIAGWIQLSDDAKRALIAALAARRARFSISMIATNTTERRQSD
jgi:uncharacterized protein